MRPSTSTLALLLLPPAVFLPVGLAFSVAARGPPGEAAVPWMLLCAELLLAGLAAAWLRRWNLGRAALGFTTPRPAELAIGALLGVALALTYQSALAPALDWLRLQVGDVVPPGETRRALGSAVVPFAIANIVLAPFVEELLYRGILEQRLRLVFGPRASFVWGIVGFGALHFAGGVIYVFATALVGVLLLWLRRYSKALWLSLATHLAFNIVEVLTSV